MRKPPVIAAKRIFYTSFLIFNFLLWLLLFSKYFSTRDTVHKLELCPISPPNLIGAFEPDVTNVTLETVENRFKNLLQPGGYHTPNECRARDRVAVIVAVRDREFQIPVFLKNIHPLMMRQQIEYQIFIVEQAPGFWFNKGTLFNVGFVEALKVKRWDCFIFHDVDLYPMDDRNLYNCPRTNPRHMGVACDLFDYK